MTKDELWEKYAHPTSSGFKAMFRTTFEAALKEYGEHVMAEAVKVCEAEYTCEGIAQRCAAAIEKMPLP